MSEVLEAEVIEEPEVKQEKKPDYFGIAFGQKYIDLGFALQNPNSSITLLAEKANACGLALILDIVRNQQ